MDHNDDSIRGDGWGLETVKKISKLILKNYIASCCKNSKIVYIFVKSQTILKCQKIKIMKMNRTMGQIVKPIIIILIIICCLCITTINCDGNLDKKRSVLGHEIEKPVDKITKLLQSHDNIVTPVPLNSEIKNPKVVQENVASAVKVVTEEKTGKQELTSTKITNSKNNNATNVNPVNNTNATPTPEKKPGITPNIQPPINNGALLRGASVFLGLSIVVVAYIIFRCARLNKSRTQMVRKYGILAHRQDVEMRPLPLNDEDEDDNTVFDASEIAAIHDKQRRMT